MDGQRPGAELVGGREVLAVAVLAAEAARDVNDPASFVPPIALWGLVAIPFYVAADLLAMYAVIGANSSAQTVLFMPLAVQEMVLAVWMIARGFRPAAESTTSEHADGGTLVGV